MRFWAWLAFAVYLYPLRSYGQWDLLEQQQANARLSDQRVLIREFQSLLNREGDVSQLIENQLWELSTRGPIADLPLFLEFLTLFEHPKLNGDLVKVYHQEVPQRLEAYHNGEFARHIHIPEIMEPDLGSSGGVMARIMNPLLVRHLQQRVIGYRWLDALGLRVAEIASRPSNQKNLALIAMFLHQARGVKLGTEQLALFTLNYWNWGDWNFGDRNFAERRALPEMVERIQIEAQILIREQATFEFYEKYFRDELDRVIPRSRSSPRMAARALEGFKLVIALVKAQGSSPDSLPILVSYLRDERSRYLAAESRFWINTLFHYVETVRSEEFQARFDTLLVEFLNEDGAKLPQEIVNGILVRLSRRPLQREAAKVLVTFLDSNRTKTDSTGGDGRGWNGQSEMIREKSREYLSRLAAAGLLPKGVWNQLREELSSNDIIRIANSVEIVRIAPFEEIRSLEDVLKPLLKLGTAENSSIVVKVNQRLIASHIRTAVASILSGPQVPGRLVVPKSPEKASEPTSERQPSRACYPTIYKPVLGLR